MNAAMGAGRGSETLAMKSPNKPRHTIHEFLHVSGIQTIFLYSHYSTVYEKTGLRGAIDVRQWYTFLVLLDVEDSKQPNITSLLDAWVLGQDGIHALLERSIETHKSQ